MKGIKHYIKTFKNILRQHGFAQDAFYTYHYRPKKADEVNNFVPESMPNVGIVIQGPIKKEDDFTIETIKLYQKYYPDSPIFVSIWDTELDADIAQFKTLCGEDRVVISHFEKGDKSHNYQIVTAGAGIKKAYESGCEYIMKTRTDQRLYAPQVLSSMVRLIHTFPVKISSKVKGRLICNGMGTFGDRLYNLADMFVFGASEDVLRYFTCPKDERDLSDLKKIEYINHLQYEAEYSKWRTGEIWFASHYLESLGFSLKWTLEDSDYYRRELFCIVDNAMLDLLWPKYTDAEYRWINYQDKESFHPVSFMEWFNDLQKDRLK